MYNLLARQMVRQRSASRLLSTLGDAGRLGGGGYHPLGLVGFQRLDRQLELLGFPFQLL